MSKAFDTVHLYKFLHKNTQTNMPNTVIKCLIKLHSGKQTVHTIL